MNNKDILIDENSTILEALKRISSVRDISRLILFVSSSDNKIIGSVTDGDIRRALIKGFSLDTEIKEICFNDFIFRYESEDYIELNSLTKGENSIKILPLLFKDKTLSRIIDLEKYKSLLPVECVIMSGGRGKRLSPLTDSIPKPMLPISGKPIIEHNIDKLISYGIKKIHISIGYLGNQIIDYFGDGSKKGIQINYIKEDKPLGTAGSLSLIKNIKSDNIILINSDLFTNVNYERMYLNLLNNNADIVIASKDYKVDIPFAIFESDNFEINSFKEKPSYTFPSNAGIYIFKKKLISMIPKNTFYDITDLMQDVILKEGKLIHDPIVGYWICLLYTSPSPRDRTRSRMPSSA